MMADQSLLDSLGEVCRRGTSDELRLFIARAEGVEPWRILGCVCEHAPDDIEKVSVAAALFKPGDIALNDELKYAASQERPVVVATLLRYGASNADTALEHACQHNWRSIMMRLVNTHPYLVCRSCQCRAIEHM
jgi:hypothetical protein